MTTLFSKQYSLELDSISQLRRMLSFVCKQLAFSQDDIDKVMIVVAEYLSNLYFHQLGNKAVVKLELVSQQSQWVILIVDYGESFDPYSGGCNDIFTDDLFTSGMGVSLIREHNQAGKYESFAEYNCLTFPIIRKQEKKRVVIVDDERSLLKLYEHYLSSEFQVEVFTDTNLALKYISHESCDLIIADIHMPEMTGFEFRTKVESFKKSIFTPFIFLTGDNNDAVQQQASDSLIDGYLLKPISKSLFISACNQVIRRSNQLAINYQQRLTESIGRPFKPTLDNSYFDWDIALAHSAASDGGGDFVFSRDFGDKKIIVLGDIMGHDAVAKFHSFAIMGYLDGFVTSTFLSPKELLGALSEHLYNNHILEASMLTCAVICLDKKRTCSFSVAGHPPPYLINNHAVEEVKCQGSLLGLFSGEQYEEVVIKLADEEQLVFYTDGIFESIDKTNEWLKPQLANIEIKSSEDTLNHLWMNFETCLPSELEDDSTAIVIGRKV